MDLMSFRPLVAAGASWAEIGRLAGCDWRTARRYLTQDRPRPPTYGPRPPVAKMIDPVACTIDAWLRAEPLVRAFTIFERLQAEPYGFKGSYETVKRYVRVRRPDALRELGIAEAREQMHRRFEVLPGSQAQVDWGDEGTIATPGGDLHVSSSHMVLSHSRDPFCRYTASQDLGTFWACHDEAFRHFGGVDRLRPDQDRGPPPRRPGPGGPPASGGGGVRAALRLLHSAVRPRTAPDQGPGGAIGRDHPRARPPGSDVHLARGHAGSVGRVAPRPAGPGPPDPRPGHRGPAERERAALLPLPEQPYVVCERHIRSVGKDALVSFEASLYSVPWTRVRPRQRVELRITREEVDIFSLGASPEHLATHPRATSRGSWVVDEHHWDGLPDGRAAAGPATPSSPDPDPDPEADALARMMVRVAASGIDVARRDPATYDQLFHTKGGSW